MRKTPLAIVLAVALGLMAASSASAAVFGIGDQNTNFFTDARWQALPLKDVRRVVEWDTNTTPAKAAALDAWMDAAKTAGATPLLAIDRSTSPGKATKKPTTAQYTALIKWLKGRYPGWSRLTPWNEANFRLQPTYKNPKLALDYYKAAKKACGGCIVTSPTVLSAGTGVNSKWIAQFLKLGGSKIRLWSFHNYGDLNRKTDKGLKALEKVTKGTIWLTEAAGWVKFGTAFGYNEKRAAGVIDYTFKVAKQHKRIAYVYFWQWLGTPGSDVRWDSGFLNPDGSERAGYQSLRKGLLG